MADSYMAGIIRTTFVMKHCILVVRMNMRRGTEKAAAEVERENTQRQQAGTGAVACKQRDEFYPRGIHDDQR